VFDKQYWVRDDGKGGQVIKARCGSEVSVQLLDRNTGQALLLPDVTVKLYVVNGQNPGPPGVADPPGGLYLAGGLRLGCGNELLLVRTELPGPGVHDKLVVTICLAVWTV